MPTENASAAALLCAVCGEGFFRSGPHRCESCDSLAGMPGYIAAAGLLVLLCVVVLAAVMYGKFTASSYRSLGSELGSDRESNPLKALKANDSSAIQVHFRQYRIPFDCSVWVNTHGQVQPPDSGDLLRLLHLWQVFVPCSHDCTRCHNDMFTASSFSDDAFASVHAP